MGVGRGPLSQCSHRTGGQNLQHQVLWSSGRLEIRHHQLLLRPSLHRVRLEKNRKWYWGQNLWCFRSELYTYDSKPNFGDFDNRARSLIGEVCGSRLGLLFLYSGFSLAVSGCSAWTLYQYDHYEGASVCVTPSSSSSCSPGFYLNTDQLGVLAGGISSVRRGCYSGDIRHPGNNLQPF